MRDFGLLTDDEQVGADLSRLFNQLSGLAPRSKFKRLLVAPRSVRQGLIDRIEAQVEAERRSPGAGYVGMKVNSIVGEAMIDALYRASPGRSAGRPVGARHLRPAAGVAGLSDHITVHSVLGRFLEHSRIFLFGRGGTPRPGSAAPT